MTVGLCQITKSIKFRLNWNKPFQTPEAIVIFTKKMFYRLHVCALGPEQNGIYITKEKKIKWHYRWPVMCTFELGKLSVICFECRWKSFLGCNNLDFYTVCCCNMRRCTEWPCERRFYIMISIALVVFRKSISSQIMCLHDFFHHFFCAFFEKFSIIQALFNVRSLLTSAGVVLYLF